MREVDDHSHLHSWGAKTSYYALGAVGKDLGDNAAHVGDEQTVFGIKSKIVQAGLKISDYR